MSPGEGKSVLAGPRSPFWSCSACTRSSNWACRIKCQCGQAAPAQVVRDAKRHAGSDKQKGGGGGDALANERRLRLAAEAELAKLQEKSSACDSPDESEGPSTLEKIRRLEKHASEHERDYGKDSIHQQLLERLEVLRKQLRDSKPAAAQHRALAARAQKASKEVEKLQKQVEHLVEEQQRIASELEVARVALEQQTKLLADTNVELVKSAVAENEHKVERVVELVPSWLRDIPEFTVFVQNAIAKRIDDIAKQTHANAPTIVCDDSAPGSAESMPVDIDDDDISDAEFDAVQSAFTQQSEGTPEQSRDVNRAVLKDLCKKLAKRRKHL
jgi:hypothetical protein